MNSRSGWTIGCLWTLALAACRTTSTYQAVPGPVALAPVQVELAAVRTPAWVGEPLSWEKLADIETWIATHREIPDPYWRIEGELQLNQGRLEFARRETGGSKATPATVRTRVHTARAGLQRIAADEQATPSQKKRAGDAIARCEKMLGVTQPAVVAEPALVRRAQWGAMPPHAGQMEKGTGRWRRITVHHSADREPPELDGSLADSAAAVRSIQKAHMDGKETGYGDIGYHFLIDPYGRTFQGRDLAWQGAHAAGDNNFQNIGVCLIGNFETERPSAAALEALEKLVDHLRAQHKIPRASVVAHHELKSTICPGRNLAPWVQSYRRT